jgi:non-canonical purine NTP pyrophosphatase (RdgB/HAM1 family)
VLYFITGSAGKFREVSSMIPGLEQLKLNLDEIQSLDPQVVIKHKLEQAAAHHQGEFIVEDTSLTLHALVTLPGTYVKWFEQALGLGGIAELAAKYDDPAATARTVIGYRNAKGESHFFTGEISGLIVHPRGAGGFGWDDIFVPQGYDQTFSQLGPETKAKISMRRLAAERFLRHLSTTPRPPHQI